MVGFFALLVVLAIFFFVLYLIFYKPTPAIQFDKDGNQVSQKDYPAQKKLQPMPVVFPKYTLVLIGITVLAQQLLLYETVLGAGWALFIGIFGLVIFSLFSKHQKSWLAYTLLGTLVVVSLGVTFRANGFVQVVNGVFVCTILMILIFMKVYQKVRWNGLWILKYGFLMIPESISHFFNMVSQTGTNSFKGKKTESLSVMSLIKTTALTLVVLTVFVGLLSQADPVFAQLIQNIWESSVGRVFSGLLVSLVLATIASFSLKTSEDEVFKLTFFSFWDVFVPVLSVVVLFGLFLFIQSQYLFGGHQDLALFDLTYSEYVRKGFIELMWATLFGSLLTYFVTMKSELLTNVQQKRSLKMINVLFAAELVLLVGSALKRNFLYIETFGLTRVRIIGNFFLIWLVASVLLLLAMALINKMKEKHFLVGMLFVSIVVILGLNLVNIDSLVFSGSPNIEDVSDGKIKDYFYLANLSEDVAEDWVGLIGEIEQEVVSLETNTNDLTDAELQRLANSRLALMSLQQTWERLDKKYGSTIEVKEKYFAEDEEIPEYLQDERKIASIKVGELRGYQVMSTSKQIYVQQITQLLSRIEQIMVNHPDQELYGFEYSLLYDYRRPFISTELDYYPERRYYEKDFPSPTPIPSPSFLPIEEN